MENVSVELIQEIIQEKGMDNITPKSLRTILEDKLNLQKGTLDDHKSEIKSMIDGIIEKHVTENKSEKKFSCTTRSGKACPKNIKSTQSKSCITKSKFLNSGKKITIDIDGNTLTGDPREFSSGNLGWYLTGKIEIALDDQNIWSQVGMSITIPGSQSWEA